MTRQSLEVRQDSDPSAGPALLIRAWLGADTCLGLPGALGSSWQRPALEGWHGGCCVTSGPSTLMDPAHPSHAWGL